MPIFYAWPNQYRDMRHTMVSGTDCVLQQLRFCVPADVFFASLMHEKDGVGKYFFCGAIAVLSTAMLLRDCRKESGE